jgi:peptidoglycan-N-acetylglucosamine deacetylase
MIGKALVGVRTRQWIALCVGFLTCLSTQTVSAADCPGHPDALGTSRTLVVDPREHPRIGTMQYPETLPLEDHEVVLTFDDGPLPRNSNQVLDILAAQCVKATFFVIGRQAQASPEGVRKLRDAGHSIGTHTQNHPLGMKRLPIERARQEIDDGIASVKAALGDDAALAPFFRIPGLSRAEIVEDYLASQGIQIWSADFPADDWRHVSSSRVYDLAIKRLEDKGRGILLLHDIQARTVAALPRILHELKVRGYRIVHVVPATSQQPATPTETPQWQLHPPSETVAISHWPKIPNFVFTDAGKLPAPALSGPEWHYESLPRTEPLDAVKHLAHGVPLQRQAPWPLQSPLPADHAANALPVPASSVFEIREGLRAAMQAGAPSSRRAELALPAHDPGYFRQLTRAKRRAGRVHQAGRANPQAAHARSGTLKHLVQVRKRSV